MATRLLEHKPGIRKKDFSAIKENAEITGHDAVKTNVTILEKDIKNHEQRLFLEAWHSIMNKDTVNEHIEFPTCYLTFTKRSQTEHKTV